MASPDTTTFYKRNAAAGGYSFSTDDISTLKKIRTHLATCECCRRALRENESE